jgi:hypothetical protein
MDQPCSINYGRVVPQGPAFDLVLAHREEVHHPQQLVGSLYELLHSFACLAVRLQVLLLLKHAVYEGRVAIPRLLGILGENLAWRSV